MKQLKFMLAAATAVGIAAAAQAAETINKLVDNENFDEVVLNDGEFARDMPGYSYSDPGNLVDDESTISTAAEGYNGTQSLKVNTGTNALLRALSQLQASAQPLDLAEYKSVYIDTMVQFTVTPAGDTVEAGEDDKLMIYLKECVGSVNDDGSINFVNKLMVKSRAFIVDDLDGLKPADSGVVDYDTGVVFSDVSGWHHLVVTAKNLVYGEGDYAQTLPVFTVEVDESVLSAGAILAPSYGSLTTDATLFPSLLGTSDTTLTYVGFAGEGLVDNLTVATVTEVTTVDFTIAWNADGFSAVTYTINGGSALTPENGVKFTINSGDDIVITPVLADWYKRTDSSALTYTDVAAKQSVTFAASKVDQSNAFAPAEEGGQAPTATDVAEALQINNEAFKGTDAAAKTTLEAAIKWAQANSYTPAKLNDASFSGVVPANQTAEAFLLDCADDEEAVAAKKAAFKFPAFTPGSVPAIDEDFTHNGTVTIKGATAVDGVWGDADATNHKFFKAVLTK